MNEKSSLKDKDATQDEIAENTSDYTGKQNAEVIQHL
jgi:hypothetical protein